MITLRPLVLAATLILPGMVFAQALPQACGLYLRFLSTCHSDMTRLYRANGQDWTVPSSASIRSSLRADVHKAGVEKVARACESIATTTSRQLANLTVVAAASNIQFSDDCGLAIAQMASFVDHQSDAAASGDASDSHQAQLEQHNAITASQWARDAKDQRADFDAAYNSATEKLPLVAAACPDVVLIKQLPPASAPTKPVVLFASKQCGYAVSYWPESDDAQVAFDKTEIDGWIGYCTTPMGTVTSCTRAPKSAAAAAMGK